MVDSFLNGKYETFKTLEVMKVYRVYGGKAPLIGSYVTTSSAKNRINAKIEAALLPSWKNTREFEAIINIPKGTVISYGKVAPQIIEKTGTILKGGIDQIILPQKWDKNWIQSIYELH